MQWLFVPYISCLRAQARYINGSLQNSVKTLILAQSDEAHGD